VSAWYVTGEPLPVELVSQALPQFYLTDVQHKKKEKTNVAFKKLRILSEQETKE
jgi:hypothetical protein